VSEKDGEVSCSVEETNRIRALLGLRVRRGGGREGGREGEGKEKKGVCS